MAGVPPCNNNFRVFKPYHEKFLEPPKFLSAANASLPAAAAAVAFDGAFARPLLAELYRERCPFDLPED